MNQMVWYERTMKFLQGVWPWRPVGLAKYKKVKHRVKVHHIKYVGKE